jgi:Putative collagen-binding domain of a collagenase
VAASITPDGSLAVLYPPAHTTVTIDQAQLHAGYSATWVDPATGANSAAATGSAYSSTTQGSNSQGDPDWVLVLQAPLVVRPATGLLLAGII